MTVVSEHEESSYSAFYNIYKQGSNNASQLEGNLENRNNSLFNLSPQETMLINFIIQGVGITTVSSVGIIGNIFSMLVLSKKKMRSPIGCFLFGLALADTVFVCLGTAVVGFPYILAYFGAGGDFGLGKASESKLVLLTPIFFGLALTSQTASVYFTMAVTTERYIAICHPFKARRMLTLKRAVYVSLTILTFAICYNGPRWWEYETLEVFDEVTNEFLGYKPIPSQLRLNEFYDIYYVYLCYLVFMEIFPIVVLCILNIKIYNRVRLANKQRQTLSSSQQHENSLAVMLLVVVMVFLLCNSIPLFETLYQAIRGSHIVMVELECIRNFLVLFNSSINFVIYCFFGEKFRDVFLEMWPACIRRNFCCCCPATNKKLRYWNGSFSDASSEDKRRWSVWSSFFTTSTKSLPDTQLASVSTHL